MNKFRFLVQILLSLFLALLCPKKGASKSLERAAPFPALRPGDVILMDLGCYSCRMISATTSSPFNHSGLVVEATGDGVVYVAQSLSKTEKIPLADFLSQAKRHSALMVRRPRELHEIFLKSPEQFDSLALRLKRDFAAKFEGHPFDEDFLWDNVSENGEEPLYCSEMILKALNKILGKSLAPLPMDFSPQMDFWTRYFKGHVPQGLPGYSPGLFERDALLLTIWDNGIR